MIARAWEWAARLAGTALLLAAAGASAAEQPMRIVAVPSTARMVHAVTERLTKSGVVAPPGVDTSTVPTAVAAFCQSWQKDTPSALALSRRLRIHEAEVCALHGVSEIIEIQLGYQALVLVAPLSDPEFDVQLRDLRAAVARDIPGEEGFVANTAKSWRDLDPRLPDFPIRVLVPPKEEDSRVFFEERFLEAACRRIPRIRAISAAPERVERCTSMREDGVVEDLPEAHGDRLRDALRGAAPGTVAVLPMIEAKEMMTSAASMAAAVRMLAIDGVPPSPTSIAARTYPFIQPIFVYVKKLHVQDYLGRGAVQGLRELITELTREQTVGPDGYLVPDGLVPMLEPRRVRVRDRALTLTVMDR